MGIFGSVSSQQVDDFAKKLAADVFGLCTNANAPQSRSGKAGAQNVEQQLNALFESAAKFREEHKLGLYKKARLANTFRWEMKERGYDDKLAEELTERLVVAVARKKTTT